jgi:hypothetical protein
VYEDVAPGQILTPEDRRILEEALARGFDGAYLYRGGTWLGLRLCPPAQPPEQDVGGRQTGEGG